MFFFKVKFRLRMFKKNVAVLSRDSLDRIRSFEPVLVFDVDHEKTLHLKNVL